MRGSGGARFMFAVRLFFLGVNVIAAWAFGGPEINSQEHGGSAGNRAFPNVVHEKDARDEKRACGNNREPRLARHVNSSMSGLFFRLCSPFFGGLFPVMLVVPEPVARVNVRSDRKIVFRGRIRDTPFVRAAIPGIAAGFFTLEEGVDHYAEINSDPNGQDESTHGCDHVGRVPAHVAVVHRGTTRHAVKPEEVHREESDVKTGENDPERNAAPHFAYFATANEREPVVNTGEKAEDRTADEHVVEMRDNKITVL